MFWDASGDFPPTGSTLPCWPSGIWKLMVPNALLGGDSSITFPPTWSCKNFVALEKHQALSPFVRPSEKIQTTICCNDEHTNDHHVVVALFLHQNTWYIWWEITSKHSDFLCNHLLLSDDQSTQLNKNLFSFLGGAGCPMCGSPSNDSGLSLNLWCYSDPFYWNIIHWTEYHSTSPSPILPTAAKIWCQWTAWDDPFPHLEMFHAQGSSLRLIMPTKYNSRGYSCQDICRSRPQYTCYNVGVFVSVLELATMYMLQGTEQECYIAQ
jgi:hypothetical protein